MNQGPNPDLTVMNPMVYPGQGELYSANYTSITSGKLGVPASSYTLVIIFCSRCSHWLYKTV
jgi:hypothetical protein